MIHDGRKLQRQMLDRLICSADSADLSSSSDFHRSRSSLTIQRSSTGFKPLKVVNTLTFCVFFFEINYHYYTLVPLLEPADYISS